MPFHTKEDLDSFLTPEQLFCSKCLKTFMNREALDEHEENHELRDELEATKQERDDMKKVAPSKGLERMLDGLTKK